MILSIERILNIIKTNPRKVVLDAYYSYVLKEATNYESYYYTLDDKDYGLNPEYEIIKGSKGGLAKCENNKWFWQDFVPSIGYVKTRDMDRDEEHAYLAIQKYGKFANSNIRM